MHSGCERRGLHLLRRDVVLLDQNACSQENSGIRLLGAGDGNQLACLERTRFGEDAEQAYYSTIARCCFLKRCLCRLCKRPSTERERAQLEDVCILQDTPNLTRG